MWQKRLENSEYEKQLLEEKLTSSEKQYSELQLHAKRLQDEIDYLSCKLEVSNLQAVILVSNSKLYTVVCIICLFFRIMKGLKQSTRSSLRSYQKLKRITKRYLLVLKKQNKIQRIAKPNLKVK